MPGPYLGISGCIGQLGIAERGLEVLMPQPLANGREADPAVDELAGMCMPELMERAAHVSLGTVRCPALLDGLVAERTSAPILLCPKERAVPIAGLFEIRA